MPDQAFIVPRRNDLDGVILHLNDLRPNTSQRNLILDGPGQSGYLKYSLDVAGTTTVDGDAYVSGSTDTTPITAVVDDDTTSGGDDVEATTAAEFGLEAYLRDRVNADPGIADTSLSVAEAATVAGDIRDLLTAGDPIDVAAVDASLTAAVGAATDFDGATVGGSKSFGTIPELMRILRGEVYRVRALTIINDVASAFQDLAARQVFVDAQTTAQIASQGRFYSQGEFLVDGEAGFRNVRQLTISGALRISCNEGVLSGYKDGGFAFLNPSFTYGAGGSAVLPDGTAVDTDGVGAAVVVYDNDGNVL